MQTLRTSLRTGGIRMSEQDKRESLVSFKDVNVETE